MPGGCTTYMGMYGSGVRTGKVITRVVQLLIRLVQHRVRTGCSAVVVATAWPWTAGRPLASGASLATVPTPWGSGLLFLQVSEPSKARNRTPQPRKAVAEQAGRRRERFDEARSARDMFLLYIQGFENIVICSNPNTVAGLGSGRSRAWGRAALSN
jgi:hypothetical protein